MDYELTLRRLAISGVVDDTMHFFCHWRDRDHGQNSLLGIRFLECTSRLGDSPRLTRYPPPKSIRLNPTEPESKEVRAMEATFFKFAFFLLMGLAILGLLTMATVAIVFWLRIAWLWLRTHVRTAEPGHV